MVDRIENIIEHFISEQTWKKKISAVLVVLSLVVVTGVFWSLKMNGIALAGDAFCGKEEHIHSEECYEQVLICTDESEEHEHSEECYEKQLICELEEHTHTTLCYSNTAADLENQSDWETTLPQLSGNWSEDVVKIAQSQLGYEESRNNFILDEDGQTQKGYSRYGEWYGNPYGNWDGMFVSFCLTYANIPQEAFAFDVGTYARKTKLEQLQLYQTQGYQPHIGDVAFLDNNQVGIISQVTDVSVRLIVGDSQNKVQELGVNLNEIIGYGNLNQAYQDSLVQQVNTLSATIYTNETYSEVINDDTTITLQGLLPQEVMVKAYPTTIDVEGYEVVLSYDIQLYNPDGSQYIPTDGVSVTITSSKINQTEPLLVYDSNNFKEATINNQSISFTASHFSNYAVVKAVVATFADANVNNENDLRNAINGTASTIQLTGDFAVNNPITINKDVTIDLNGHELTANSTLFNVNSGTLTIIDSQQKENNATEVGLSRGNEATANNNVLTYYVTETKITDPNLGTTQERLVKHEVPYSGRIKGTGQPVVNLTGGTFNLESGMIYGGTNRAINMTGGTLNLKGGYIFGFSKSGAVNTVDDNSGGAIKSSAGTINLSGTVLAGNKALNGGAIYAKGNTQINMSNGVISGNISTRSSDNWGDHSEGAPYRCGGGGIFMTGSTKIELSGGYITNNKANDNDYFDGGGGILFSDNSEVVLTNGYITGNVAAGGGGIRSDWNKQTIFRMSGGYVSDNEARTAEGGGIAITQGGTGYIYGGYINNNVMNSTSHWGGGGVFCSDGSYLFVKNVLVTNNDAGGFGGGVAGCSTGRVFISVEEGGGIWDNEAQGVHMSGDGSQKNQDHTYGFNSPVFMANGYQDYFCALNSVVYGEMLGGGAYNWSGSIDGVPIKNVGVDDILEASYVMGLTSDPSTSDKEQAIRRANLYINGNDSYTHGGGILCNGYLIIGKENPIHIGSRFTLLGNKKLLEENGSSASLEGHQFKFSVKDEAGNIVSVGTSDEKGNINFDRLLTFSKELCETKLTQNGQNATFTYYLSEDKKQDDLSISIDPTIYKIEVTVILEITKLPFVDPDNQPVDKYYYKIPGNNNNPKGVVVTKSTDGGKTWTNTNYNWKASDEQHAGELKINENNTFINQKQKTTHLTVVKKWEGTDHLPDLITIDLLRDGKVVDTITLPDENNEWSYTWNNLAKSDENGKDYVYTVYEHPVPGYETSYIDGNVNEVKSEWVLASQIEVGRKYLLITHDEYALTGNPNNGGAYDFNSQNYFTKVNVVNDKIALDGITPNMQWKTLQVNGDIVMNTLPSGDMHYLSYQKTDTVKAANRGYASQVEIDSEGYLILHKENDASTTRYVQRVDNTLKATTDKTKALKAYVLVGDGESQDNIITIVNKKVSNLYDIELTKISATDSSKVLEGAKFQLLQDEKILTFRLDDGKYILDVDGEVTELETDENGKLYILGLPLGTYTLKETQAPPGYEIADPITVHVDGKQTTIQITVEDQETIYELPETGGRGTYVFMFIGLVLMVIPLIYINRFKQNKI